MSGFFQSSYQQARTAFLRAVQADSRVQWKKALLHPLHGAEAEPLALDAVWLGRMDARRLLVLQSATHGIEGFAGSAVQVAVLHQALTLPEDTALLLLHAMNPWGFSHRRRVDEAGIDLNRNFVDFSQPPENTGYKELADALIPAHWTLEALATADQRLADFREVYGEQIYEEAVSGGQYTHPRGLFYGGRAPGWSRLQLQHLAEELRLAERDAVAIIDVHTGLGEWSVGEIICDHPPRSIGVEWARAWYGDAVTEPFLGTSSSVPKWGLIDFFWHQLLPDRCSFVTLEYGTGSTEQLFNVLRADHWLATQAVGQVDAALKNRIQAELLEHFCPAATDWRQAVVQQGLLRVRQALEGLSKV
ncbi:DUF2817 domain-containing protein [Marinospirillum alkaliphilum]|uniref:Zinc carboxypeptidase n=1 Tax=Marinospirillum alkaliphilum DSM 21637 TaxID=1122209 RepID=A0A1K1VWS6_9GAMM|nr:DUF2817 domain-containing protein [Marinospirillum alkaliphilum]SFX29108.1 Protein of unknown function [Marinospirillum alkaliphilum DSM 21637]